MRNAIVILLFFVIVNGLLYGMYPDRMYSLVMGNNGLVTLSNSSVLPDNQYVTGIGSLGKTTTSGGGLPGSVSTAGATFGATSTNQFFDSLATVWSFISFLFSFILMPISFFTMGGFNLWVQWLIGVPLCIAYVWSLIMAIRGVFD